MKLNLPRMLCHQLTLSIVCMLMVACAWAGHIEWIRRGTVYLDVDNPDGATVTVRKNFSPEAYLYLYGPDGDRLVCRPVEKNAREFTLALEAGPGTYRMILSGEAVWNARTQNTPVIFEPEREWTSLHQTDDKDRRYYFRVAPDCERFTLHATNQNGNTGAPAVVRLYDPHGKLSKDVGLKRITPESLMHRIGAANRQEAELKFRILTEDVTITDPDPGVWSVEAFCRHSADDVGVWLDGTPNLFALHPNDLFEPAFPAAEASLTVDADKVRGPTGLPSVICGFNRGDQTLPILQDLGMRAVTDYCSQYFREPDNDDSDPDHINWDAFNFEAENRRVDYLDRGGFTGLTHMQFSPPSWLGIPGSEEWMGNLDEVGEFVAAYITQYRSRRPSGLEYFTFINEPNLAFGSDEAARDRYVRAFTAAGKRLRQINDPAVEAAKFGGPDIAVSRYHAPWDWISALLDAADEYVDFISYDVYAYPMLDDTWRYGDDIERVRRMIREHDTDGRDEEILIFETNLRGGLYLQSCKQDTHYSALWWASVLNHALGTGDIRAITYFTLIERGARRKGLLKEDGTPKPVYESMRMYNHNLLEEVLESKSSHAQVDCLATADRDEGRLNLFVCNRSRRDIALRDLTVKMPGSKGRVHLSTERFTGQMDEPQSKGEADVDCNGDILAHTDTLPPQSISLYLFSRR